MSTNSVPQIGPRAGKVWGTTQLAFAFNSVEAHLITITKGGYCSRHSHRSKWNRFLVVSGKLTVRMYPTDNCVDETVLGPGQITDVPPSIRHEFAALEETVAAEFYWLPLDPNDIDRHGTIGGVSN